MEYILMNEEYPFVEWNDQFLAEYTIFCESEDNLTDDNVTDDIEESAPGLYEQWLKLNGYDPKTNTIAGKRKVRMGDDYDKYMSEINDKTYDPINHTVVGRINVGKMGSNKERNRLNQFLKRNDFDPKTGTYRSDIKLADGSYARIPLRIGVDKIYDMTLDSDQFGAPDTFEGRRTGAIEYDTEKIDDRKRDIKYEKEQIKKLKKILNDPNASQSEKEEAADDLKYAKLWYKRYVKDLREIPKEKSPAELQRDYVNSTFIRTPKTTLMKKPKYSTSILKHEEGHAEDALHSSSDKLDDRWYNVENEALNKRFKMNGRESAARNHAILNSHDKKLDERYADIYSAKHNPYIKSSDDAYNTEINQLNDSNKRFINNLRKNTMHKLKTNRWDDESKPTVMSKLGDINTIKQQLNYGKESPYNRTNYARAAMLKAHLDADPEFQKTESKHKKTNAERAKERKERGDLTRKQKKKQKNYKEYMI